MSLAQRKPVDLMDDYLHEPAAVAARLPLQPQKSAQRPSRLLATAKYTILLAAAVAILLAAGALYGRHWIRTAVHDSLPQVDGNLALPGLAAAVTVRRDSHGVPHIHAQSLDDLVFAQGFVIASDRLFQMDSLRRHAAGELAEILGAALLPHDRLQRTLQIRAAADRAVAQLPADQLHLLQQYAAGVNASMQQQAAHLPVEFRILGYKSAPWTPRDSILVSLAMFEDLTDEHQSKLAREALEAKLTASGERSLIDDLYPVGSWRDHPPSAPQPDLTVPGPPIEEIPLDESQARLNRTKRPGGSFSGSLSTLSELVNFYSLSPTAFSGLRAGSNNWVVSGAHTASGKPLLSNDMHLNHSVPGIWYEADLTAPLPGSEDLHVSGVTIPGLPLIVVGHNAHVAWGFTNLGADVQDVYIETTRGSGASEEFQAADGSWQAATHLSETIKVKHGPDETLEVVATQHGDTLTPILTPILKGETRQLSLRWTLYDPAILKLPVYEVATAHDWTSFLAAFAQWGGPAQNVVYADEQGHIGYHAAGRIPLRGPAPESLPVPLTSRLNDGLATLKDQVRTDSGVPNVFAASGPHHVNVSGPLSPVPLVPSAEHEWSGYIPFDQLPQVFDPPAGVIATANANVTPPDYSYPITLNWGAPYRNERIWHLLLGRKGLRAEDMLAIQTDVYSDFDHVLAQRLAYALDHSDAVSGKTYSQSEQKQLHQAADILRSWNGRMTTDSSAAAIVTSAHAVLMPALLAPHLAPGADATKLYAWFSHDYALEQILLHEPARWLPSGFVTWDDFLASCVLRGLTDAKAPSDLAKLRYGSSHTLDIEHPIFDQSAALRRLYGRPTGTGNLPQSGDGTTVKQVAHAFGPSERFTADLADLDRSTLNIVLGESGNPGSPWFLDQFVAWYHGTTYAMPFSASAVSQATTHTLTLTPR